MLKLFIGKKNYKSIQKPIYEKQLCSPVVSSQKCLFNSGNIQF